MHVSATYLCFPPAYNDIGVVAVLEYTTLWRELSESVRAYLFINPFFVNILDDTP